jgi:hypothetical protein
MGIASLHPSYALVQGKRRLPPRSKKSITRGGDDQFRNHLCSQIGKVIQCANVSSEAITITFVAQHVGWVEPAKPIISIRCN